ncbi:50S ribosomal protein L17 [bacterium]|nr:50S ribosomal protein L17 [bacterium]
MRHRKRTDKLGKKAPHRKATLSNIIASLIKHERVNTKLRLARSAKRYADKMITLAKKNTLHSRRLAIAFLRPDTDEEKNNIRKLFDVLGPRYAERPGGYTRIIKLESRRGDNAPMAILEYVGAEVTFKERKKSAKSDEDFSVDTEVTGDIQTQDEDTQPAADDTDTVVEEKVEDTKVEQTETISEEAAEDAKSDEKDSKKSGGFFKKIIKGGE